MGKTAGAKALSGSEGNEFRAWMVVAEAGVEMRGGWKNLEGVRALG